jgi:hypothetical protein
VLNFAQTLPWQYPSSVRQILAPADLGEEIMAIPKNDKRKDYARYAVHCLDMVATAVDQRARATECEMAVEWIRLADAIVHPPKPTK